MHPDQRYIDALIKNDKKLLFELYRKCFPSIREMILQNHGTEASAADIFQEALIDLFRQAKSREFILTSNITSYIKAICRNKWYDEIKKQRRLGVTIGNFGEQDIGEDSFYLSEEQHLEQAQLELIRKKFQELAEGCRELLTLSWSKDKEDKKRSTEELAKLLNVSPGYVRKKKSECIVKLIRLVMNDPDFKKLKQ
jgi:RNA polymerase sigma factor (sigma-70 family)